MPTACVGCTCGRKNNPEYVPNPQKIGDFPIIVDENGTATFPAGICRRVAKAAIDKLDSGDWIHQGSSLDFDNNPTLH